ncbi:hypothetical protein HanXRQr2_Chr09g0366111 [Helianthus annuus]|uniref:Uncharacterized protein n=1 Tax=Helianthus annuus TaxID=4232 RepID=A0A9K3I211_HELAN|nr:hypothetical protein HanXRQr2_Chr09g0366111 [Helianthus annuus]KAJ0891359.1 hypothetical protein HanPSC8_Chr09g0352781 [Helianthus annuus]
MICISNSHLNLESCLSFDAKAHERIRMQMMKYIHMLSCFDPLCLVDRCSLYHIHTTSTPHKIQLGAVWQHI